MHSPQQLGPEQLQRAQPQQQQQQQQHPSSFHDYFDHLDPSSLEPYAYVLQKPAPPAPPIQPSETGSPLPASYPTASPVAPPAATPSPYTPLCEPPDSSRVFCYKASHKEHLFKVHFPRPKKKAQRKGGSLREGDEQQQQQEPGTGGAMTGSNEGGNQGRNKFKCTVCDRRFYYERALEMHMGVHDASLDVNVLYFSCDYCPETFTEEETLQQHEARHVADGTTDFRANMKRAEEQGNATTGHRCPLCFKQFEDEPSLREHHRSHLCPFPDCARCDPVRRDDAFDLTRSTYDPADDTQPTVCNVCHRVLPTFEAYQNHFHYHTSRVPFYCYHCREEFNDKRELYNHTRTHAPRAPESYTCEVCAKVFSTKGNFKRHLKSHEAVRAFACDRCSKQYDYKSALEVHLKRSHGIEL
uniref:C2H2-type domain-containing protein n=1 Tax=Anopheles quadriannulatus TaxID=34691 RepID=A0A182XNP1_ANOQN